MIGIVERVNDEVRGARMLRIFREHLLRNRRGERLAAESLVGRPHGAEQRQRIPRRDFVIGRPLRIHRRHRVRVGVVARELVARRVEEDVDRLQERFLLRQLRLRLARVGRRRDLLEDLLRRLGILLRPQRMVEAHRLAPVRHREGRVGLLRALERVRGFVELEAVQILHALDERRLRGGVARIRERDRAELLRTDRRRDRDERDRQRQTRCLLSMMSLLLLLRRGAGRHEAVDPQIRDDVPVVFLVVAGVAKERRRARPLRTAERAVHNLRGLRIVQRLVDLVAIRDRAVERLDDLGLGLRGLLELVLGVGRLLALRRCAEFVGRAGDVREDRAETRGRCRPA